MGESILTHTGRSSLQVFFSVCKLKNQILAFTSSQCVVPPIVCALLEHELITVLQYDSFRRVADGPRPKVHNHDQQDRGQPLQQLVVRQFDLVCRLHAVRQRHSASDTVNTQLIVNS